MTTLKTISTYYASGYDLAPNTNLYITSTGGVGGFGVGVASSATVFNDGRVSAGSVYAAGIYFENGGTLVNGSPAYTYALVQAHGDGVLMQHGGSVANFGTIRGAGGVYGPGIGVVLANGGGLTNGSNRDTGAMVSGYTAVSMGGAGSVVNYGTIDGLGAAIFDCGVDLTAGGSVINGSSTVRTAVIEGAGGIVIGGASGTIRNSGTILATSYGFAVMLNAGGTIDNGSVANPRVLIQGYSGIYVSSATVTNLGTICAVGDDGFGASIAAGSNLANGAAGHAGALIEGFVGVYGAPSSPGMVVTNFGTIAGSGGTALLFASASDELVVEAACAFTGGVFGGGGSVDFASGIGTLSNLANGAVTASGSMATTTFSNFNAVIVDTGATFVDKGAVTIAAGQFLSGQGTLTIGGKGKASVVNAGEIQVGGISGALTINGAVTNTGTLASFGGKMTVTGAVTGKGVAQLDGVSTLDFAAGFAENVTFDTASFATLELGQSQGYTGTITGFSTAGDSILDLADIGFVSSTEATFSGTNKAGVLTVTDGTHTAHINLKGNYLSSTFVADSDGHGGVLVHDSAAPHAAVPSPHPLIAAMARLGGGGADLEAVAAWRPHVPSTLAVPRTAIA
ncbi:MAG: hypothetical protein ACR2F8_02270 [Caulobacteraceae bacterium]